MGSKRGQDRTKRMVFTIQQEEKSLHGLIGMKMVSDGVRGANLNFPLW